MWIPGSPESQALNDPQENRPILRQHIAVCQQETLAFIDLPQPRTNGFGSSTSLQRQSSSLCSFGSPHIGLSLDCCRNRETDKNRDLYLSLSLDERKEEIQTAFSAPCRDSIKSGLENTRANPQALFLPLSSAFVSGDTSIDLDSQQFRSTCPTASSELQSPECQLQRRTTQGSSKEKSLSKFQ